MGDNLPVASLGTNMVIKDIYGAAYGFCIVTVENKIKCWG